MPQRGQEAAAGARAHCRGQQGEVVHNEADVPLLGRKRADPLHQRGPRVGARCLPPGRVRLRGAAVSAVACGFQLQGLEGRATMGAGADDVVGHNVYHVNPALADVRVEGDALGGGEQGPSVSTRSMRPHAGFTRTCFRQEVA